MTNSNEITQERLKEVLRYNETTGELHWKVDKSLNAKQGMVAGHAEAFDGSMRIRIDGRNPSHLCNPRPTC